MRTRAIDTRAFVRPVAPHVIDDESAVARSRRRARAVEQGLLCRAQFGWGDRSRRLELYALTGARVSRVHGNVAARRCALIEQSLRLPVRIGGVRFARREVDLVGAQLARPARARQVARRKKRVVARNDLGCSEAHGSARSFDALDIVEGSCKRARELVRIGGAEECTATVQRSVREIIYFRGIAGGRIGPGDRRIRRVIRVLDRGRRNRPEHAQRNAIHG